MARARNIKPSFFTNDELAEIEPIGRLFFISLWSVADYKGELEWRPKKIKAQCLPYDDCNIEEIAINLDNSGFIRFYSEQGKNYVHIVNFCKHQNPHKNEREKGSEIPRYSENLRQAIDFKGITINRDKIDSNPDLNGTARADSCSLIPDSCSLIPEENNTDSGESDFSLELINEGFEHFWKIWRACKKSAGVRNSSPKQQTLDKKWKVLFNKAYFDKNSEKEYREEVNQICQFAKLAHSEKFNWADGSNKYHNMETGKFFTQKQWREL